MQNTRSILISDEFFCTFNLKMFFLQQFWALQKHFTQELKVKEPYFLTLNHIFCCCAMKMVPWMLKANILSHMIKYLMESY